MMTQIRGDKLLPQRDVSTVINQLVSRKTALRALCAIRYLEVVKKQKFAGLKKSKITLKADERP